MKVSVRLPASCHRRIRAVGGLGFSPPMLADLQCRKRLVRAEVSNTDTVPSSFAKRSFGTTASEKGGRPAEYDGTRSCRHVHVSYVSSMLKSSIRWINVLHLQPRIQISRTPVGKIDTLSIMLKVSYEGYFIFASLTRENRYLKAG